MGSESEQEQEQEQKPKQEEPRRPAPGKPMERDAELEAELAKQFGDDGLTRKQKEELKAQQEAREKERADKAGESEQVKADMARLAEVRARREAAAKKREEEAEALRLAESRRVKVTEEEDEPSPLAVAIVDIIKKQGTDKVSVNFLTHD